MAAILLCVGHVLQVLVFVEKLYSRYCVFEQEMLSAVAFSSYNVPYAGVPAVIVISNGTYPTAAARKYPMPLLLLLRKVSQ